MDAAVIMEETATPERTITDLDMPALRAIRNTRSAERSAPAKAAAFLAEYTWGKQSYAHEVQEQFGYFTLKEYTDYLESLGAKIIVARELLESGYPLNLGKYLDLLDSDGNERVYPASNCIIVVERS